MSGFIAMTSQLQLQSDFVGIVRIGIVVVKVLNFAAAMDISADKFDELTITGKLSL